MTLTQIKRQEMDSQVRAPLPALILEICTAETSAPSVVSRERSQRENETWREMNTDVPPSPRLNANDVGRLSGSKRDD